MNQVLLAARSGPARSGAQTEEHVVFSIVSGRATAGEITIRHRRNKQSGGVPISWAPDPYDTCSARRSVVRLDSSGTGRKQQSSLLLGHDR